MAGQRENFAQNSRRGFLRQLCSLPMIGGGVTLIGKPTAAGVPVTLELVEQYTNWLAREHGHAMIERSMFRGPLDYPDRPDVHRAYVEDSQRWVEDMKLFRIPDASNLGSLPSTRAAIVLSAVGIPVVGGVHV